MGYELPVVYDATFSNPATSCSSIDLQRGWKTMFLKVPTMTSNTEIYVNGSDDNSTFRPIYHPQQNSASPVGNRFIVNSAIGSNGGMVPIPNGFRYIKVETSAICSFAAGFKIICSD